MLPPPWAELRPVARSRRPVLECGQAAGLGDHQAGVVEGAAPAQGLQGNGPKSRCPFLCMQVNVRVVDDHGAEVADYFLEFSGPEDERGDDSSVYFHREVLEHVHVNRTNSCYRCLYADRTDLLEGYYDSIAGRVARVLCRSISAAPPRLEITRQALLQVATEFESTFASECGVTGSGFPRAAFRARLVLMHCEPETTHTMKTIELGDSDLQVTRICLGTMTFGEQNSEAEAHAQLDFALDRGVNFFDTAEMYPVPARAETSGRTEQYLGSWLKRQTRGRIILATKATGPARTFHWIRDGDLHFTPANLRRALEGSLRRLQTDYVDLYQLHWPDRNVPVFGEFHFDPDLERESAPMAESMEALMGLIEEGKVRYWGLSNETPWGVMTGLRLADEWGLPRPVSVQNAYNLINRIWENGLAEIDYREKVSLLAYSPLGFGLLSGKYLRDPKARGRVTLFQGFAGRYAKPNTSKAVTAYAELAEAHGLTPTQLALAFVYNRWCVGSTIIGATSMAQLEEDIATDEVTLEPEVLAAIEEIHLAYPNPAP